MEIATYRHYFIIIGLMVLTGLALIMQADVPATSRTGIKLKLPERVGSYEGQELLFCQSELCMKNFLASQIQGSNATCPACGGELDMVSLGEKRVLPPDTEILKKQYVNAEGRTISVSIVLSGKEQKSIHRPQQCLPAQGHLIERSETILIPINGHGPLKVMLLDLRKTGRTLENKQYRHLSSYAYWFVGTDKETPYHLQRLLWMSVDRIFHNIAHRWAYIAIATDRREGSDEHIKRISDFIAELYPLITLQQ